MNLTAYAKDEERFKQTAKGLFKIEDYKGEGTGWLDIRDQQIVFYAYTEDGEAVTQPDVPKSVKKMKREKAAEGTAKLSKF